MYHRVSSAARERARSRLLHALIRATSLRRRRGGCLYCGSSGPYSNEHVVSAGLGGDDRDWMLRGCVCAVCNTRVFSPLEGSLLRSSYYALPRLFEQPTTRDRKTAPGLQTTFSVYREQGAIVALRPGGQHHSLAQLSVRIREGEKPALFLQGHERGQIAGFLERLYALLDRHVWLIEKLEQKRFRITPLHWDEASGHYLAGVASEVTQPPAEGIWHDPRRPTRTADEGDTASPDPRVFQRSAGQIVCTGITIEKVPALLALFKHEAPKLRDTDEPLVRSVHASAKIHFQLGVDLNAVWRSLLKIGLNLAAHVLGTDLIRRAEFDRAVNHVRYGKGQLLHRLMPQDWMPSLPGHHVLLLSSPAKHDGTHALNFSCSLYGFASEFFELATLKSALPELPCPFVLVDYTRHRIQAVSKDEYVARVIAAYGEHAS